MPGELDLSTLLRDLRPVLDEDRYVIATALAAAGISSNPVAGYYHDHLFVPWSARQQALAILRELMRDVPPGEQAGS